MNSKDLYNAIGKLDDDVLEQSETSKKKKHWITKYWKGAVAAALVLAIIGGIFLHPGGGLTAYAIAQPEYPKMAPYPGGLAQFSETAYDAWWEDVRAQRRDLGDTSDLQHFFAQSAQTFLTGAGKQNRAYSPLSVYLALSMLAQLTGGGEPSTDSGSPG